MVVRNVVAPALQPEPSSHLKHATRDVSFLRSDSRCRRYVSDLSNVTPRQVRNQGRRRRGESPLDNFSPPMKKCVGRSLKLLDTVQKFWTPLRKLFAPPGVPSWLRACSEVLKLGTEGQDFVVVVDFQLTLSFLLLRWKAADTVFVVLSFQV